MVEKCPWKSLLNGAVLILVLMAFLAFVLREFVWTGIGFAVAIALLFLHQQHEQFLAERGLSDTTDGTYAEQLARLQANKQDRT